jgi:hypothetical protein
VVEPAPAEQPEEAEGSGDHYGGTPTPAEVDAENEEGCDGSAEGAAAVKEGGGKGVLLAGEPFADDLGGGGPVAGFPRAEEKTQAGKAEEALGERGEHGDGGVPGHGEGEAAACAEVVHEAATGGLAEGVSDAEGDDDGGVVGVGPVVLEFEEGREEGEGLAVDIVDDRGGEEEGAYPPAEAMDGAAGGKAARFAPVVNWSASIQGGLQKHS